MRPALQTINDTSSLPPTTGLLTIFAAWSDAMAEGAEGMRRLNQAEAAAMALWPPQPFFIDATAQRHWDAQTAAIDSSFGVPGLTEAMERAYSQAEQLAKIILNLPPSSLPEVAAKYAVVLATASDGNGGIDDARPLRAFLAELEQLARRDQLT